MITSGLTKYFVELPQRFAYGHKIFEFIRFSKFVKHSWKSIRLGIEGLLVLPSPPVESLCCDLEQDAVFVA